jgi:hypothetical protein
VRRPAEPFATDDGEPMVELTLLLMFLLYVGVMGLLFQLFSK